MKKNLFFLTDFFDSDKIPLNPAFWTFLLNVKNFLDYFPPSFCKIRNQILYLFFRLRKAQYSLTGCPKCSAIWSRKVSSDSRFNRVCRVLWVTSLIVWLALGLGEPDTPWLTNERKTPGMENLQNLEYLDAQIWITFITMVNTLPWKNR